MKLFAGLGNPGPQYSRNRHNAGFLAVERIAGAHKLGPWRRKFQGETTEGEIAGVRVLLLKPQTYMNESGRAVAEAARFHKIPEADIIVFYDEIDLEPGRLKVKTGGGNAGHNGLRSISAHLGNDYVRVRIGVGHPGAKELVAGYVLHDFAKADALWLDPLLDAIATAAARLATGDLARFQTDVARALHSSSEPEDVAIKILEHPPPSLHGTRPSGVKPVGSSSGHPAGERAAKRQTALARNLAAWQAKRAKSTD